MMLVQMRAEASAALAFSRLEHLTKFGVLTKAQAARIAERIAADAGAEIGTLKAQTMVDFHRQQSDV